MGETLWCGMHGYDSDSEANAGLCFEERERLLSIQLAPLDRLQLYPLLQNNLPPPTTMALYATPRLLGSLGDWFEVGVAIAWFCCQSPTQAGQPRYLDAQFCGSHQGDLFVSNPSISLRYY